MKTRADAFSGSTVAMITPFKNGKIDFDAMQKQVEFQIAGGTSVLSPTGTTGESPTLTHEEQHEVIRKVVEFAAGRVKVLAGTGSNNTAEAISLSQYAQSVGADGLLIIGPYYNKPTQEGMYLHFKTIAEAVDIPICVYNVPGRTGKAIDADTILRLSELKNIAMVKDATGSMDSASKIISNSDLTVLSGDDSLTLPFMSIGARGVVSVVANFAPNDVAALCAAMNEGNLAKARELHKKLYPLSGGMLSIATNPIPVKRAMQLLGRDTGEMRLPMTELEPEPSEKVRNLLVEYGLLAR